MFFDIILDIECPRDQALECNRLRIQEFLAKESIEAHVEDERTPDHGCWEDDEHGEAVGINVHFKDLTPEQADSVMRAFDLTLGKETVEVLQGFGSIPSLRADGDCRYSRRFSRVDQRVVEAYVTPWPSFVPNNRKDDGPWQERCWERIRAVLLRRWG